MLGRKGTRMLHSREETRLAVQVEAPCRMMRVLQGEIHGSKNGSQHVCLRSLPSLMLEFISLPQFKVPLEMRAQS